MACKRMSDQEYARLSNLKKYRLTNRELVIWREEFALRNEEEAARVRMAWLSKPENERKAITEAAAPILARGWQRAQQFKKGGK